MKVTCKQAAKQTLVLVDVKEFMNETKKLGILYINIVWKIDILRLIKGT